MRLLIAIVLSCSGLGAQNCPILNTVPNKENIVGMKKIGVECVLQLFLRLFVQAPVVARSDGCISQRESGRSPSPSPTRAGDEKSSIGIATRLKKYRPCVQATWPHVTIA